MIYRELRGEIVDQLKDFRRRMYVQDEVIPADEPVETPAHVAEETATVAEPVALAMQPIAPTEPIPAPILVGAVTTGALDEHGFPVAPAGGISAVSVGEKPQLAEMINGYRHERGNIYSRNAKLRQQLVMIEKSAEMQSAAEPKLLVNDMMDIVASLLYVQESADSYRAITKDEILDEFDLVELNELFTRLGGLKTEGGSGN